MASATKRLSLLVVNCAFRIPPRAHATQIRRPQWQKPFSVTCPRSNVERRAANEQSHQERAAEAQEVEEKQGFDNVAAVEKAEAPPEASPVEEQPSEATEEQLEAVARGGSVDGQALNAQYLTKQPLEESLVEDRVSEDTTPQQPDQHKTVTDAGAVEEPLLEPSEPEVVLESSSAEQNLLHSSTAESDRPAVSPSPLIDDQDLGALESHPDPATRPDGQSLLGSSSDEPVLVEEEVEDDEDVSEQLTIDAGSEDIPAVVSKGQSSGFWSYTTPGSGDEEFLKENVTSLGHDELEQQREYREYARLAAWELPLLSKLARPFTPPSKSQPLRFRYTSYLGEAHPAATKVVLEFSPSDIPDLTDVQRTKLIKLLGVRFNPSTGVAKMSCESFDTQAQNKRYLADKVDELLDEARDPKDTFEDVPLDFRHHRPKTHTQHEFPKEWIMTEERRAQLREKWGESRILDQERAIRKTAIDGAEVVKRALAAPERTPVREPVMVGGRMLRPSQSSAPRPLRQGGPNY